MPTVSCICFQKTFYLLLSPNRSKETYVLQVVKEFGSFSSFMWGFMDYKPIINKFKYSRNVPLRSPKAEIISKDMIKRGFRFVGPVIVHSFMQAAGLTIDHLVDCYRHGECVSLAERPWRHIWYLDRNSNPVSVQFRFKHKFWFSSFLVYKIHI